MTPLVASLCLFAAALPLSIAGANAGWGLAAAALAWGWSRGRRPDFSAARSPLWAPLWAYFAAALLSDLLGADPAHSLRYLNQDFHKVWLGGLLAVAFAAGRPRALTLAFAAGAAAAALIGIGQCLAAIGAPPGPGMRAHAFVHPVTYGEQMALLLVGALAALLSPPEGFEERRARAAAGALALLLAVALFLSNTRGAILGFAAGAAALALARPGGRKAALAVCGLGVAAFLTMEFLRQDRSFIAAALKAANQGTPLQEHIFARVTLWKVAVQMGRDHLWTGAGVNNYRALLPRYFTGTFEDFTHSWGTAHNLYLHHFAERGLAGLAALAWILGTMLLEAARAARRAPGFWTLWALGAVVAFLVFDLSEVALQTEVVWMLLWAVWFAARAPEESA